MPRHCRRPGQTGEMHVHHILPGITVDEQMNDLIMQKWAAQRAVQDREAQTESVEANLQEAALANAQLAADRAVLSSLRLPPTATAEEREAAVEQINDWQAFRQKPADLAPARRQGVTGRPAATPAVYIGTLFGSPGPAARAGERPTLALQEDKVVQLTFFWWPISIWSNCNAPGRSRDSRAKLGNPRRSDPQMTENSRGRRGKEA